MGLIKNFKPQGWGGTIGALLAVLAGLAVYQNPWSRLLENSSYDLLFLPQKVVPPEDVVIVYLDEDSHKELGQKFNQPWDRNLHGRLVERMTAAGAKAVVFDIVFSDLGPDRAADHYFAAAMESNKRVVLAADSVSAAYGVDGVAAQSITPPLEMFSVAAASVGSAEMAPDHDMTIRRHLPAMRDDLLPGLSWAAAQLVKAPVTETEASRLEQRWVHYYGPPATIPNLSYYRALSYEETDNGLFRDKVVFVGARMFTKFSGERKDEYRTPYSSWMLQKLFMSGVEIQATIFLNLIRGDWLNRLPLSTERWALTLVGFLAGFGLARLRPAIAVGTALLGAAAVMIMAWFLCTTSRVCFPWLIVVVVQIPLALLWAITFNTLRLYFENRLLGVTLGQHLSPSRVKQLLKTRDVLHPGAEKTELSIMFTDIADFSVISEHMDSDELARLMNDYFEAAISCVHETDGFLVKLIGDALFVIWNAPIAQPDHRERAARTALLLQQRLVAFTGAKNDRALRTRIGLHTGVANVGNFGSTTRFDYTAIGENINLASRMEGLNKHLGTGVLATGETAAPLDGLVDMRMLGHFRLKGFQRAVAVHEILGPASNAETTRPWRETFAQGLRHFQQREMDRAREAFVRTLELRPDDGPSLFYIGMMEELVPELIADDWHGEVDIKEK
ncbi:MAG: adenylate/guanylate cyclase domain-containing protein [Verrucomicrobia bacterium]|nr:adenylate/guanylate cyclase domain-containing protein [Verrucomicrobiota bacterium]